MKKCASEKYLIMRSALDDKSTLVNHAILARIAGKLRLVIRHQPRDKRWKHVPRINYARSRRRNQWTESHPEKEFHGKWFASFQIQIHERSNCGSVSQLWRERYRKKIINVLHLTGNEVRKMKRAIELIGSDVQYSRGKGDLERYWNSIVTVQHV